MRAGTVRDLMARYGQQVQVRRDGALTPARAFLRPVTRNRKEERQYLPTPLGLKRKDRFLYLGEPGTGLQAGLDQVLWNGTAFQVETAQPIYLGQTLCHWWAVLVPADKEET